MLLDQLKPNAILRGALFSKPVQVIAVIPLGTSVKLYGKGLKSGHMHEPVLRTFGPVGVGWPGGTGLPEQARRRADAVPCRGRRRRD